MDGWCAAMAATLLLMHASGSLEETWNPPPVLPLPLSFCLPVLALLRLVFLPIATDEALV